MLLHKSHTLCSGLRKILKCNRSYYKKLKRCHNRWGRRRSRNCPTAGLNDEKLFKKGTFFIAFSNNVLIYASIEMSLSWVTYFVRSVVAFFFILCTNYSRNILLRGIWLKFICFTSKVLLPLFYSPFLPCDRFRNAVQSAIFRYYNLRTVACTM